MMNTPPNFRSDKPIIDSQLCAMALQASLLESLYSSDIIQRVPFNKEIVPEFPRHKNNKDNTRILISYFTDRKHPTTITALDADRLSNTVNIDAVTQFILKGLTDKPYTLETIKEYLPGMFAVVLFDFVDTGEKDGRVTGITTDIMSDAIAAWISIVFHDPQDIWIQVTGLHPDDGEEDQYCIIKAIKPRRKN